MRVAFAFLATRRAFINTSDACAGDVDERRDAKQEGFVELENATNCRGMHHASARCTPTFQPYALHSPVASVNDTFHLRERASTCREGAGCA